MEGEEEEEEEEGGHALGQLTAALLTRTILLVMLCDRAQAEHPIYEKSGPMCT